MKLLLHTCCAPCLIYPFGVLKNKGYEVTGFFYNPNIHPLTEYRNRKKAIEQLSEEEFCRIIYPEYLPEHFFQAVNLKEGSLARCAICWRLRLKETAKKAKLKGYTHFSTTLLVSPYQDQELLKAIGKQCAEEEGAEFYYQDFRPGFRQAHEQARRLGIYCQKYCGCIYSEIERCKNSTRR